MKFLVKNGRIKSDKLSGKGLSYMAVSFIGGNMLDENFEIRIKKVEDELREVKKKLNETIKFLDNIGIQIDKRIKNYMDNNINTNINNFDKKTQMNSIDLDKPSEINNELQEKEVKREKIDISNFVEEFQEFDFIQIKEFEDEMENEEIMGKIIELVKKMLGVKDNKISKLNILKEKLENEIEKLNSEINLKIREVSNLDNEKQSLQKDIENLNIKYIEEVNKKEVEINNLADQKEKLVDKHNGIEKDLKNKLNIKEEEIEKLKTREKNLIEKNDDLNNENKSKDEKIMKFMHNYEQMKNEVESIGDLLEARKLYDKYLSMETRILSKLENVLIQRDFESFVSSGYTLSSLDNIWDIVKIEYKNISSEDRDTLKEIFSFFLSQINKRFKNIKYGLVKVEIGEDFDAVNQVDLSQNSRGKVTECVFYGYGFFGDTENMGGEPTISKILKSPLVLTI